MQLPVLGEVPNLPWRGFKKDGPFGAWCRLVKGIAASRPPDFFCPAGCEHQQMVSKVSDCTDISGALPVESANCTPCGLHMAWDPPRLGGICYWEESIVVWQAESSDLSKTLHMMLALGRWRPHRGGVFLVPVFRKGVPLKSANTSWLAFFSRLLR